MHIILILNLNTILNSILHDFTSKTHRCVVLPIRLWHWGIENLGTITLSVVGKNLHRNTRVVAHIMIKTLY